MIDEKILKNEERAVFALRSLYKSYGYKPFKMSKFEEYDLYVENKDFLVSDRIITFNDTDGRLLALKPDVTLSIVKNTKDDGRKQKVCYNENVYRVSGSTGQYKELMQTGLECIGDIDISDIFEVVYLAAKSLAEISESFILDISHMGILSSLLSEASDNEKFKREITEGIANKNSHGIKAICQKYSVSAKYEEIFTALASMYGDIPSVIAKLRPICTSDRSCAALSDLEMLAELIADTELSEKVRFDFSVVNNMSYYDGIVFRGFLAGICEGVLAGGEYGKLLSGMGRKSGAVGFALYLDLLEELEGSCEEYDADVLLVYTEAAKPSEIAQKKRNLVAHGKSVLAQKSLVDGQRFKEVIYI